MAVIIDISTKDLDILAKRFRDSPDTIMFATISALNKSADMVKTALKREIRQLYAITDAELSGKGGYKGFKSNNLITLRKATKGNCSSKIEVRGSTLNLSRFLQSPKMPISHKGLTMKQIKKIKTPSVRVLKGQTKRLAGTHTFVASVNGRNLIFERDGKSLKVLRTLSTAQMASNANVSRKVNELAKGIIIKKVEQEIEFRLSKGFMR